MIAMKKKLVFLFCAFFALFVSALFMPVQAQEQPQAASFVAGKQAFLLNGKPFVIRAAELHYTRIPKAYWEHRIQLCKAMGMNTICIYLFWNIHEQQEGVYDFTGQNDVAEFVRLVQQNGMYCIVRPGPYVCAEWEMGGLPWWLLKKNDIQVRSLDDAYFMERTKLFLKEAGKQLAPLQIQRGGNIIMVQVENEYASFGSDGQYMEAIRDAVRAAGFDQVQLFRCDWASNFNKYKLDGVATTINFGAGSNVDDQFKRLLAVYPEGPLMCSEYWTGWFDHWGRAHETRSVESFIGSLKDMLDRKISFSLYMAHGGTTFGQWGGANAPPYSSMTSSYDYNAPIGEQGNLTEKFYAVRNLLKSYLQEGEVLPDVPKELPLIEIPSFSLTESAALFANLPEPKQHQRVLPMEQLDQGWGSILYRKQLPAVEQERTLRVQEVHDWVAVYVDGTLIGTLDRRLDRHTLVLPPAKESVQLDILVEGMGRVNYGKAIIDRKGITEKVELIAGGQIEELKDWTMYSFPVDYAFQKDKVYTTKTKLAGPAWYKGSFQLDTTGDTFLDMRSWGKGMVWVNGHNLGRFWEIGPQQTLFVPGVWLKKGENEVLVFDLKGPSATSMAGLSQPILDELRPETETKAKKVNLRLDLRGRKPIAQGTFAPGAAWQTVDFEAVHRGRYVCFEALSAQKANDPLTTVAEIELIGADNKTIAPTKWKLHYVDSEETEAGNSDGTKVFDTQESTFWQSQARGKRPGYPPQLLLDLGEEIEVKALRYLPRTDNKTEGMVKDYRIYIEKISLVQE